MISTIRTAEGPLNRVIHDSEAFALPVLCCPVCGNDYNHVQRVYARIGTDNRENGTVAGLPVLEVGHGWRRSAVVMEYRCEGYEHLWRVVFQQHKGVEFCSYEIPEQEGDPTL